MSDWTYGVELEWPDVDVHQPLPDDWAWSRTDYTIVNSDGVANDPKHELVAYGGELNSPVCADPADLAHQVAQRWDAMKPGYNYRSNLHIHVGVPGLAEDLGCIQAIARFSRQLGDFWRMLDPLDGLLANQSPADLPAACKRQKHSERSRHYLVPAVRHGARMRADTVHDALAAEVPRLKTGAPGWALAPREAVNLRSLRKHGTVEFRCFAAPRNPEQVAAAASFARDWLAAALHGGDALRVVEQWGPYVPRQEPFQARLEEGWAWTNLQHNTRAVVAQRLQALRTR